MFHSFFRLRKKILFLGFIIGVQVIALYKYTDYQDLLKNVKFSYVTQIYAPMVRHSIEKIRQSAMPALGAPAEVATAIPVLTYHGVVPKGDETNVSLDAFLEQMQALHDAGYEAISLDDFTAAIEGKKVLKGRPFLLTFDDGRKDSYYPVDPILRAYGWKAVIYVISEHITEKRSHYYLSRRELQNMLDTGRWYVQAHTHRGHSREKIGPNGEMGHFYSNKLWLPEKQRLESVEEFSDRVRTDFEKVKNDIEETFGRPVTSFAYPFGDYGQETVNFPPSKPLTYDIVKTLYQTAFTQVRFNQDFSTNYPGIDAVLYRRISVPPDWSGTELLRVLEDGAPKTIPYSLSFHDNPGWRVAIGGLASLEEGLLLYAKNNSVSSVFLDGTRAWKDYAFTANLQWETRTDGALTLLARYQNDKNYASCVFWEHGARIEMKHNNEMSRLREVKRLLRADPVAVQFGIQVKGSDITCLVNGTVVAETRDMVLPESLGTGGIGIRVWQKERGYANALIEKIHVEQPKEL